jgi:hypothetical protein
LLDVGAVAICRVDAFPAVDKHAENDPRPVWRPVGLDSEVVSGSCNLCHPLTTAAEVRPNRDSAPAVHPVFS